MKDLPITMQLISGSRGKRNDLISNARDIRKCLETFLAATTRGRMCYWYLVGIKDVAKHPTVHKTALPNEGLSSPKYQWYQG